MVAEPIVGSFQLSEEAFARIQQVRRTVSFHPVLEVRLDLELEDRTTMELILMLQNGGWQMELHRGRQATKPLKLGNIRPEHLIYYANASKLELNHCYLESLLSMSALLDKGSAHC